MSREQMPQESESRDLGDAACGWLSAEFTIEEAAVPRVGEQISPERHFPALNLF
jgi:hypothetical protein